MRLPIKLGIPVLWITILISNCATTGPVASTRTLSDEAAFQSRGLEKSQVAKWEDGMRTDGSPGSYKWWYFDANLDDGSTLVIVFHDKNSINPGTGISPRISISLDRPGGTAFSQNVEFKPSEFSALKDQ